jgi:hypothetical protein
MDVIVESARDRRTLDWLIERVGREAVTQACARLVGRRKPYVSNVAKALGLKPPANLDGPMREEALARLAELRRILGERKA